ncbi:hypothetical protein K9O30_14160 [Clostridium bowmanii]|uniref:hypothetical protein n=1 Tax=Clostridium bowmanii TaxID=132925 RepID=UPI001C0CBB49|nr:hypothetical protein [Clostridium bowmanii]MBU3190181.1 hypothetical protein [Clostridium bowmanii]MCA1074844.1 hypothetical protein [Clostridium bowmanii]
MELKLSYSTKKKSDKVCELKQKVAKKYASLILLSGISCLLGVYALLYNTRYISYATAVFENRNLQSAIKTFDLIILVGFAATLFILYISLDILKKDKKNYDEHRKDLIKTINSEFCTCVDFCNCKEEYIKFMEEKGIDLIFL